MAKTSKQEVVAEAQLSREKGYLYFLDKQGDIGRRRRNTGHVGSGPLGENHPNEKVVKLGVKKQKGYLYFLKPKTGGVQVRRVEMQRGRTGRTIKKH